MKKSLTMKNSDVFKVLKNIIDGTDNDSSGVDVNVDLSLSPVEMYVQVREWLNNALWSCDGGMDGAKLFVEIGGYAGGNEEVKIEWNGTWTPGRVVCMIFSPFDGCGSVNYITGTGEKSEFINGVLEGIEGKEQPVRDEYFIHPMSYYEI